MVDYDKLTIEVWTDGSLKAHEALSLAAKKINDRTFRIIYRFIRNYKKYTSYGRKKKKLKRKSSRNDNRRIRIISSFI